MTQQPSWIPSRKWITTQITAVAALLVAYVNAGEWNKTLVIALIGVATQALLGYLVPNAGPPSDDPPANLSTANTGRHAHMPVANG